MAEADVLRRVAIEALRVATQSPDEGAARAAAEAVGRRVGGGLSGCTPGETARALGLDTVPSPVAPAVAEAFLRGVEAGAAAVAAAAAPAPARPMSPWAGTGRRDLVAATRRAMHDLNQPLTVILGYAAILKRADTESVRMEAAEQIVKEARKMNEIITDLSRLARSLDAA